MMHMKRTYQALKINACGKKFSVIFHTGTNCNPYWIYEHTMEYDKYGFLREHKRLVEKYQNMDSCLYYLASIEAFRKDVFV